jgi:hypothetical protein
MWLERAGRNLALIAAAAVAVASSGCGGSSGSSGDAVTATTASGATSRPAATVTVTVKDAQPVGGIGRATVRRGDRVLLVVHSDVADEIHLHGYNRMEDVAAGGTARISFVASVPGRFEAELEHRGVQIAEITVSP